MLAIIYPHSDGSLIWLYLNKYHLFKNLCCKFSTQRSEAVLQIKQLLIQIKQFIKNPSILICILYMVHHIDTARRRNKSKKKDFVTHKENSKHWQQSRLYLFTVSLAGAEIKSSTFLPNRPSLTCLAGETRRIYKRKASVKDRTFCPHRSLFVHKISLVITFKSTYKDFSQVADDEICVPSLTTCIYSHRHLPLD